MPSQPNISTIRRAERSSPQESILETRYENGSRCPALLHVGMKLRSDMHRIHTSSSPPTVKRPGAPNQEPRNEMHVTQDNFLPIFLCTTVLLRRAWAMKYSGLKLYVCTQGSVVAGSSCTIEKYKPTKTRNSLRSLYHLSGRPVLISNPGVSRCEAQGGMLRYAFKYYDS